MPYWLHPKTDKDGERRLVAAWEVYKRSQSKKIIADSTGAEKDEYADASDDNTSPLPLVININTTDSATLVRLKGIGPSTAGKIIARIRARGPFSSIDQLLEIRSFPKETFNMLKRHLTIADTIK